jgi:hypothetical protein
MSEALGNTKIYRLTQLRLHRMAAEGKGRLTMMLRLILTLNA